MIMMSYQRIGRLLRSTSWTNVPRRTSPIKCFSKKVFETLDQERDDAEAKSWLNLYYNLPQEKIGREFPGKAATFFHHFYKNYNEFWDPHSATLLEFGGGPSISPLFSACPFVSKIVFTEYTAVWRKQVEMWKAEDPGAFDWTTFCKYVIEDLEGNRDKTEINKRLSDLRTKVAVIAECDFHCDDPIAPNLVPPDGFDIISHSYVFTSCVSTMDDMVAGLKRLSKLLKPGGFLTGVMEGEMDWYKVSPNSEPVMTLWVSDKDVPEMFGRAGFIIVEHKHIRVEPSPLEKVQSESSKLDHCIIAQKPSS